MLPNQSHLTNSLKRWDASYPLHYQVANRIREKIISKQFAPGSRLPGRRELHEMLDVCQATVQTAMDLLAREGYIEVRARKLGTLVSENPPHLSTYKVLIPKMQFPGNRFFEAMTGAATQIRAESGKTLEVFAGLNTYDDIAKFQTLTEDVLQKKAAGLIFFTTPKFFQGTVAYDIPGIPKVSICCPYEVEPGPRICFDYESFFEQAIGWLKERERRKIALVAPDWWDEHSREQKYFRQAMQAQGMEISDLRLSFLSVTRKEAARLAVQMSRFLPEEVRADGLVVADEHLVEGVEQGLKTAGARLAKEVDVICHHTQPAVFRGSEQIARISFNATSMLRRAVETIDLVRAKRKAPEFVLLKPEIAGE